MTKSFTLIAIVGLLVGACSSPSPHVYVLSPLASASPADQGLNLAVGVGPVELPDYLDRNQIVTRSGQNELNLAEFDLWGAPLKDNTAQVLAENLAVLLPSNKVLTYPWKRSAQVRFQTTIKITRFEHLEGGETVLGVRWSILDGNGAELLTRESRYVEKPAGDSYPATVAAMNRALAQFSHELAVALKSLQNPS